MSKKPGPVPHVRKEIRQAELLPQPKSIREKLRARAATKVGTIALTFRIDPDRYKNFTQKVAMDGTTKQDVMSQLLDDYLGS